MTTKVDNQRLHTYSVGLLILEVSNPYDDGDRGKWHTDHLRIRSVERIPDEDIQAHQRLAISQHEKTHDPADLYAVSYVHYLGNITGSVFEFMNDCDWEICEKGQQWLVEQNSMIEAWEKCPNPGWMIWGLTQNNVISVKNMDIIRVLGRWVGEIRFSDGNSFIDLFPEDFRPYAQDFSKYMQQGDWHDLMEQPDQKVEHVNISHMLAWMDAIACDDTDYLATFADIMLSLIPEKEREAVGQWMVDDLRKTIPNPFIDIGKY